MANKVTACDQMRVRAACTLYNMNEYECIGNWNNSSGIPQRSRSVRHCVIVSSQQRRMPLRMQYAQHFEWRLLGFM